MKYFLNISRIYANLLQINLLEKNMSNLKSLKSYLVGKDSSFLLDDNNNGKTVMLSGVWGAGKTHFWQHEIEPKLQEYLKDKDKDNEKACVYVSLYGKDSLQSIKQEVFIKASNVDNLVSKEVSTFGFEALSSIRNSYIDSGKVIRTVKMVVDAFTSFKGKNRLKDGGIVCFDDFERKSHDIDLNDLFGFISHLAIDMNCKVIAILNSDVFRGDEAKNFREVKEKTINKFFYFEPSLEELFRSIFNNEKYTKILHDYEEKILEAIKESGELNARFYIQVLDNCLEWLEKGYSSNAIRTLTLVTINFIKNHFVLDYEILEDNKNKKLYRVLEKYYRDDALFDLVDYFIKIAPQNIQQDLPHKEFMHVMYRSINKKNEDSNGKEKSDAYYQKLNTVFDENKEIFYALYYYGYVLKLEDDVTSEYFQKINNFVKTGILD